LAALLIEDKARTRVEGGRTRGLGETNFTRRPGAPRRS
jgi:hypothetical protein